MNVDEISVLKWKGEPPRERDIISELNSAEENGFEMVDRDLKTLKDESDTVWFVMILYFREKSEDWSEKEIFLEIQNDLEGIHETLYNRLN